MSRVRVRLVACWRLMRVLTHILGGMWTILLVFPRLSSEQQEARVQVWAVVMLARFGIDLVVVGQAPVGGPVLLAANHISWLDIVVIHAARHCRFVSKAELRHWPLVGVLARGAGTLFIERESRRDAMRVVHHMAERLRAGGRLFLFSGGNVGLALFVEVFDLCLDSGALRCCLFDECRAVLRLHLAHFGGKFFGGDARGINFLVFDCVHEIPRAVGVIRTGLGQRPLKLGSFFGVCGGVLVGVELVLGRCAPVFAVTEIGFVELLTEVGNGLVLRRVDMGDGPVLIDDHEFPLGERRAVMP